MAAGSSYTCTVGLDYGAAEGCAYTITYQIVYSNGICEKTLATVLASPALSYTAVTNQGASFTFDIKTKNSVTAYTLDFYVRSRDTGNGCAHGQIAVSATPLAPGR